MSTLQTFSAAVEIPMAQRKPGRIVYVDSARHDNIGERIGTVAQPFATVAEALAVLPTVPTDNLIAALNQNQPLELPVIFLQPGSHTEDVVIDKPCVIKGHDRSSTYLANITALPSAGVLIFEGLRTNTVGLEDGLYVDFKGCDIAVIQATGCTLQMYHCSVYNGIFTDSSTAIEHSIIVNSLTFSSLTVSSFLVLAYCLCSAPVNGFLSGALTGSAYILFSHLQDFPDLDDLTVINQGSLILSMTQANCTYTFTPAGPEEV